MRKLAGFLFLSAAAVWFVFVNGMKFLDWLQ